MRSRWWVLAAVSLATFMTYLDNNVVNVALPTIERELGLTLAGLEWIVSGYILAFAGLLLAGGRLADVFGLRVMFFIGLGVFTAASVAAGLAGSQETLIAARVVQGVGAALVTPTSLALIRSTFVDARERATAVGIWGGVSALALAVGPLTGGVLSENISWGWIFLINAPIAVVVAVIAAISLPASVRQRGVRIDIPGVLASSLALFALTFALIEGEGEGWTSGLILGSFALAAAAFVTFLLIESRSRQPMIDLSLFRARMFSGGLLSMGMWAFGVFGIYFFTAIYLQSALGFSPTEAGAGFVPMALLMAAVAVFSPLLARRIGTGPSVAAGLALMAVAMVGLSTTGVGTTYLELLPWFLVFGAGGGMLVPLSDVIISAVPAERAGVASGMLNVSREVFGLLGITILGAILNARQTAPTMEAFLDAYQFTLLIAAAIVLVGVPIALYALRRGRPVETITEEDRDPVLV
ncbi:MFS transporter [Herbidospora mongoliensis]|uniref:MFS transporter n=1 Tax=Herbidospora mongoliensis TaxID=688067 RepID=UPI0009FBA23A|nr:MFS transporter [Herbidospora mongoliensis]